MVLKAEAPLVMVQNQQIEKQGKLVTLMNQERNLCEERRKSCRSSETLKMIASNSIYLSILQLKKKAKLPQRSLASS
jgi:hypothetical protein